MYMVCSGHIRIPDCGPKVWTVDWGGALQRNSPVSQGSEEQRLFQAGTNSFRCECPRHDHLNGRCAR